MWIHIPIWKMRFYLILVQKSHLSSYLKCYFYCLYMFIVLLFLDFYYSLVAFQCWFQFKAKLGKLWAYLTFFNHLRYIITWNPNWPILIAHISSLSRINTYIQENPCLYSLLRETAIKSYFLNGSAPTEINGSWIF